MVGGADIERLLDGDEYSTGFGFLLSNFGVLVITDERGNGGGDFGLADVDVGGNGAKEGNVYTNSYLCHLVD